jgi:dolichyl-phosphate-mannose-protein mannosyltransferase
MAISVKAKAPWLHSAKDVPDSGLDRKADNPRRVGWIHATAIIALVVLGIQLHLCSRAKSATYDEQYHIAKGLTFLRTGDPRLVPEHPPLIAAISAMPLLTDSDLVLPLQDLSWQDVNSLVFSDLLLWKLNPDGPSIITRARLPIIMLTLFLGVIVYAWGNEMYGRGAGLLALALFTFDPNILAHGCLATNDIGLTTFATLALYTFWRWRRYPSWRRATIAGAALGLAQVSKYSALFLLPVLAFTVLVDMVWNQEGNIEPQKLKRTLRHLAIVVLAASFTVWAVYGFQVGMVRGYPVPARDYFTGLKSFTQMIESGKTAFLLGSYSDTGWWYYFPVTFTIKTPLPLILLTVCSLIYAFRRRTWRHGLPLLVPVIIYFGACLLSPFNIGYRHLLPILPFLFIFAGQLAAIQWKPGRRPAWAVSLAVVWLVIGSTLSYPHYLAYFNELVGGPDGGHKVLGDSNIDWGQDLIGLREFMNRENIASVKLAYLGTADPRAYGISYELLPGFPYGRGQGENTPELTTNPPGGVYAISISCLQGFCFKNHDLYASFRASKPDAIIGHSIFIYRVPYSAEGTSEPGQ